MLGELRYVKPGCVLRLSPSGFSEPGHYNLLTPHPGRKIAPGETATASGSPLPGDVRGVVGIPMGFRKKIHRGREREPVEGGIRHSHRPFASAIAAPKAGLNRKPMIWDRCGCGSPTILTIGVRVPCPLHRQFLDKQNGASLRDAVFLDA